MADLVKIYVPGEHEDGVTLRVDGVIILESEPVVGGVIEVERRYVAGALAGIPGSSVEPEDSPVVDEEAAQREAEKAAQKVAEEAEKQKAGAKSTSAATTGGQA